MTRYNEITDRKPQRNHNTINIPHWNHNTDWIIELLITELWNSGDLNWMKWILSHNIDEMNKNQWNIIGYNHILIMDISLSNKNKFIQNICFECFVRCIWHTDHRSVMLLGIEYVEFDSGYYK